MMAVGGCVSRGSKALGIVFILIFISLFGIQVNSEPVVRATRAPETIIVDINRGGDYTSIQEAIDNASNGDTVYVQPGIYYENIKIYKTLSLVGAGKQNTTINSEQSNNYLRNRYVIEITADGVTLTGFKIMNGTRWSGIVLNGVKLVHIYDNTCSNNHYAITLEHSHYNTIENNTISRNKYGNILVQWSNFNIINNNTFLINKEDNLYGGIWIYYSYFSIIKNNSMSYCSLNIAGDKPKHWIHTIENNTLNNKQIIYLKNQRNEKIINGVAQIILANCSNIIVEDQNFSDGSIGIILGFSNNITVRNNTFYGNNDLALKLSNSKLNNIINNTFMSNAGGIYLWNGSNSNNIINNTFHDIINSEISLWDSNRNSLINNKCTGRWGGIILRNSSFSTIINNSCKNTYGISIDRSNSSIISNNKLISSGYSISGSEISHWNSHTLDLSNQVNGKPICYLKNIDNVNLNYSIGQAILVNCSNIKIENKTFNSIAVGITIVFSNNITIRNNTFNNTISQNCIELINSDFNTINNNKFSDIGYGIKLWDCSDSNILINNTFIKTQNGIRLSSSDYNLIQKNNCSESYVSIYLLESDNNKIITNNCSNNIYGIYLENSDLNLLSKNICNFNEYEGINIENSQNNTPINNICSYNIYGISLYETSNSSVINNTCCFNDHDGLGLLTDSSFINNNICNNNNENGISLNGFKNKLFNNTCTFNNHSGIIIIGSGNLGEYNIFSNNKWGLNLDNYASRNIISNNTLSYNYDFGLGIHKYTNNNIIYKNKIISNRNQIVVSEYNDYWNNSAHQGNYWSDYTGVDNGANGRPKGDGIGDTKIPHQGVDYYPFVNPNATTEDDGDGGYDSWLGLNFNTCRTLSILLIILIIVLFFILRRIFTRKKPEKK